MSDNGVCDASWPPEAEVGSGITRQKTQKIQEADHPAHVVKERLIVDLSLLIVTADFIVLDPHLDLSNPLMATVRVCFGLQRAEPARMAGFVYVYSPSRSASWPKVQCTVYRAAS